MQLVVAGLFARANSVNNNMRLYPKKVLVREVRKYVRDQVLPKCALGELDHPSYCAPTFKHLNLVNLSHQVWAQLHRTCTHMSIKLPLSITMLVRFPDALQHLAYCLGSLLHHFWLQKQFAFVFVNASRPDARLRRLIWCIVFTHAIQSAAWVCWRHLRPCSTGSTKALFQIVTCLTVRLSSTESKITTSDAQHSARDHNMCKKMILM